MEILEVDSKTYAEAITNPSHIFNSAAFNALNASKCQEVFYLLFKDSKVRLGIIFGVRNNILTSPFSAPFGGFESISLDIRLQQIDMALTALETWAQKKKFQGIRIISPSFFYNESLLNKIHNCLYRANFVSANVDLNYQFPTNKFDEDYTNIIWYNAKKNLKRAQQSILVFEKLSSESEKIAYDVIAQNRKERGFPLRMTWEQVQEANTLIVIDFFVVKKEETPIGAALIFHVTPEIVQVVYWGDLPEFAEYKTMNFLSFNVFQYYKNKGIKIIDIGPSTENSIPNNGLCEFKESIGCDINIKTEFYKKLN
jgi:hypothetical protein